MHVVLLSTEFSSDSYNKVKMGRGRVSPRALVVVLGGKWDMIIDKNKNE